MSEAPPAHAVRALRRLFALLLGVGAALVGGGGLWGGVDFAVAVLLGCLLVVGNLYWMTRSVSRALQTEALGVRAGISYALRFGVSLLVLYVAIVQLDMDAVGIAVGVSALVIASVLYALWPPRTGR